MGSIVSWFQSAFETKQAQILLIGLDAAGKTTIVNKLKLATEKETVPTIGFSVQTVQYKNVKMHLWDVGGQERLRQLWRHYYDGANAIIWVLDSNDRDRADVARAELERVLKDPMLAGASLLVLCNKQDLPNRLTPPQVVDILGLKVNPELTRGRKWFVQGCSAASPNADGLYEGLDWLSGHLPSAS
jgi:ADP-ribosylation factor protein 1